MNNVKKIVADYLKSKGFDGLYNEIGECGCDIDDLMPCRENSASDCAPALKVYCSGCGEAIYVPDRVLEIVCERKADKLKESEEK